MEKKGASHDARFARYASFGGVTYIKKMYTKELGVGLKEVARGRSRARKRSRLDVSHRVPSQMVEIPGQLPGREDVREYPER